MKIHALFASRKLFVTSLCAALLLAACGSGGGGAPPPPARPTLPPPANGNQPYNDPVIYSSGRFASLPSAVEAAAITRHRLVLGGNPIAYTATTGHITATDATTGAAQASFFYVAYTVDGQDPATRPVTFFYNGGPGSASVWLHLGSFGPKRLVTGNPSTTPQMPFPLVDNQETLLDLTDLVFVDAVGSGYSQAIAPHTNQTFWGVDADARVFRDFVARYLAVNNRMDSPRFLFGESYGTARSAVLAHLLEIAGIGLNGVVLQSPVMNYNSNCAVLTVTVSCAPFLPTYSAAGAYFNRVSPPQPDVPLFMQQMRDYTATTYAPAVTTFLTSGALPVTAVLNELNALTGITTARWQADFNLDPWSFQNGLLPGTLLGRYDARVSAPVGSALASQGDPSSTIIGAQFNAAIADYLFSFLQYGNASTYVLLSNAIATWDFSHDGNPVPDLIPDLAAALALNPQLKVLAVSGYHDLATPFHLTELDLARLGSQPNVAVRNYSGGHMTYLDDTARAQQRADLQAFYQGALTP